MTTRIMHTSSSISSSYLSVLTNIDLRHIVMFSQADMYHFKYRQKSNKNFIKTCQRAKDLNGKRLAEHRNKEKYKCGLSKQGKVQMRSIETKKNTNAINWNKEKYKCDQLKQRKVQMRSIETKKSTNAKQRKVRMRSIQTKKSTDAVYRNKEKYKCVQSTFFCCRRSYESELLRCSTLSQRMVHFRSKCRRKEKKQVVNWWGVIFRSGRPKTE